MKNLNENTDTLSQDLLQEARQMLTEPSRHTKRKILIGINAVFTFAALSHIAIQLYTLGGLPHPVRDGVIFPVAILIQTYSLLYNLYSLRSGGEGNKFQNELTAWISIITCMVFGLVIIHANPNTATSFIFDASFSLIVLFMAGLVLGRAAAITWFVISMVSLFFAWQNIGTDFSYYLKTQDEVAIFEQQLENREPEALAHMEHLEERSLAPVKSVVFFGIWFIYFFFGLLLVFYESTMVSQILRVIPRVVDKINIASEERNKLARENMRMGTELDVARRIQSLVLPTQDEMAACKNLDVFAFMEPATEVGGDFVEVLPQEDGSSILAIGDVTDHGLPSGLVMLMTQTALRTCLDNSGMPLKEALSKINTTLYKNVQERMKDFRNLSLSILRYKENVIDICGQHETILYLPAQDSDIEEISTMDLGIYVGLVDDISEHLDIKSLTFNAGDIIVLYSDGIPEAADNSGRLYGMEPLLESLKNHRTLSSRGIAEKLLEDVYSFIGNAPLLDDISLIVIKHK